MGRLNDIYICDKCHGENEPVMVDVGNYEEFWGRPVWRDEWEQQSGCCRNAEAFSIAEFIEEGWELPPWAKEVVNEEAENAET